MQRHLNQRACFNPEDLDVLKRAFDVLCGAWLSARLTRC